MLRKSPFILVGLIFLLMLAGCGSGGGSQTNGSLALTATATDLTGGVYHVLATAIYTPLPMGTTTTTDSAVGVPVTVTISSHTLNGTRVVNTFSLSTDSTGTVSAFTNVAQTNETIYVDVTATTGGLTQSTTVSVPSL